MQVSAAAGTFIPYMDLCGDELLMTKTAVHEDSLYLIV